MNGLVLTKSELRLDTRRRRQIENIHRTEPAHIGAAGEIKAYMEKFKGKNIIHYESSGPTRGYNCHGLTFAARRTWIEPSQIPKILADDDYEQIADAKTWRKVRVGDIAAYPSALGEIEHSGLVVEICDLGPRILSKWGLLHEVVHYPGECDYDASLIRYYRIRRV